MVRPTSPPSAQMTQYCSSSSGRETNHPRPCRTEDLVKLAASKNLILTVYQNRRWDSDFLTVQKLLSTGRVRLPPPYPRFIPLTSMGTVRRDQRVRIVLRPLPAVTPWAQAWRLLERDAGREQRCSVQSWEPYHRSGVCTFRDAEQGWREDVGCTWDRS